MLTLNLHHLFSLITSSILVLLVIVFIVTKRRKGKEMLFSSSMSSASSSVFLVEEVDDLKEPKSPMALPIIGHLHLLGGYEVPYQAFSEIGKKYGDVARLKLGGVKSIVVNGAFNVKEVLVTKGHHFDSRPDFKRYQLLFSGNKQNSLAFSDWSYLQKSRRDMLKSFAFPRAFTHKFYSLESIIIDQTQTLIKQLESNDNKNVKRSILHTCANIFTNHFCSKDFKTDDKKFIEMIENFDDVFYEVNQGYAADFLPFLLPFHTKRLKHMNDLTHYIRSFILENVICERFENFGVEDEPIDYVESLIKQVKFGGEPELKWDTALFALEDIIGGHSAIGNFLMKMLGYLVNEKEVQEKIQEEIDFATNNGNNFRKVSISDRNMMPYTECAILEAIRLIASPIVPRVANQDSSINGYKIRKGDTLFLNNYDVSMSEELWKEPKKFMPERFLVNNKLSKPEFFLPFGGGRRGCMGYRMVQLVSLGVLTSILQNYTILPLPNQSYKVKVGSLALPKKTYEFKFEKRNITIT